MRIKRLAALSLAAVLTAGMLTGCPWDKEADETDDASSVPVTSTDTSQPGSDDEDDDTGNTGDTGGEDTETPDPNDPKTWTITDDGTLIVPAGTTSIPADAFKDRTDITSLVLPDGLTSIGDGAFQGCNSLESVYLPEGLTSIGNDAFMGCTGLTSIRVGTGIISDSATIGDNAFEYVPDDVTVYYPSAWDELGEEDRKEKLEDVKQKLVDGGLRTDPNKDYKPDSKYEEDTKLPQTTPELPNGVKGLLDTVRAFGM